MTKTILILCLVLSITLRTKAQDLPTGITVSALQQLVNGTIDKLTNAGTTLLGNGSIVMGGASQQVSALLSQFNGITRENINKPIQELSGDVRNLANQLYSVTSRLNVILNQQQTCLLLNSQIVVASVQSITSELKNGIPLVSKDAARLNYFQFDAHAPSIVPQTGGRVKIIGFYLWKNTNMPPVVSILNEERTLIVKVVTPDRSSDDNSFSFILDSSFIKQNSGKCLQIKVQPKKRSWFSSKDLGTLFLPMYIPSSFSKELKLVAHVQYSCEENRERVLDYKDFPFDNSSCEDRKNVTLQKCWTIPVNAQIIDKVFQNGGPESRNQTNISVHIVGNCITADGWLDNASCVNAFIGRKLLHSTFWRANIPPKISYKETIIKISDAEGEFTKMENQTTNLCLDLDKVCDGNLNNIFWFEIIQTNGIETTTLYTSQRTTGTTMPGDNYKGLQIDASLNPIPVNGKAQICVKVTQPQCGF